MAPRGKGSPPVKPGHAAAVDTGQGTLAVVFSASFGTFLGLSLLKFANPAIMDRFVVPPKDIFEVVIGFPWPTVWAYCLLAGLVVLGFRVGRTDCPAPRWLVAIPAVWFGWQLLSYSQSVDPVLSGPTVKHFAACTICFYLGLFALARSGVGKGFWSGLLVPLLIVLAVGWHQHFGGLKETRDYFFAYIYPTMADISPEDPKKMSSDRIFSTLFYPNTLAGALLLLCPVLFLQTWRVGRFGRMTVPARSFLLGMAAVAALGCLFWSGSKGGWLLMLVLGVVALLHSAIPKRFKQTLVIAVVLVGVAGFAWRYSGFFERGATSVGARFDYWRAAVISTGNKPILGAGPGTFAISYAALKSPEAEMARLTHNDYLQQGADSGVPAALLYAAFLVGGLAWSYRSLRDVDWSDGSERSVQLAVWLGVLGYALQGLMEFGLYIPALSWAAFAFLGWLLGQTPSDDRPASPGPASPPAS